MARTNNLWKTGTGGTYIQTIAPLGYDILINGSSKYLNFNTVVGSPGYGFRDNAGTMEFKNSGGSWTSFGGGGGGSVQSVTGLNTNNTDPTNPIVQISVDGTTITGLGTPGSPLVAVTGGTGTVTSVATAGLISGGTITTTGTITTSMATNKLVGRSTAGTGVMEEITLGTGLSFTGTTLNATGGTVNTIYNADDALTGDRVVDLASHDLTMGTAGMELIIAPSSNISKLQSYNSTGDGNIGKFQAQTDPTFAYAEITADYQDGTKTARINVTADSGSSKAVIDANTTKISGYVIDTSDAKSIDTNTRAGYDTDGTTEVLHWGTGTGYLEVNNVGDSTLYPVVAYTGTDLVNTSTGAVITVSAGPNIYNYINL